MQFARSARSSDERLLRRVLGVPLGHAGVLAPDRQGETGPRVVRLDRRVRPERHDGAGVGDGLPRVALGLGAVAPQLPGLQRIGAEMDRLDAGRDARRCEPRPVVGMEHLGMLDARHQRRGLGERRQDVERGAHGRVADRVDHRGDPAGGRPLHPLAQAVRVGHPDAPPKLGCQRPLGLGLDVLEERRRPRSERAVGETLLPADHGPPIRRGPERRAAPVARVRSAVATASSRMHAWTRTGSRPESDSRA